MKRILRALQDERGSNQIVILVVMMGALALVPIFFDFASVHYARRTAQTGSDAAVMAAAKEYAIALSNVPAPSPPTWVGFCGEIEPATVSRYVNTYLKPVAWSSLGLPPGQQYAVANKNDVVAYRTQLSPRFKMVSGVPVPFVNVAVETNKDVNLLLQEHYGQNFEAPAKAFAEVYLDRYQHWAVPCGEGIFINFYQFYWKIRLIKEF